MTITTWLPGKVKAGRALLRAAEHTGTELAHHGEAGVEFLRIGLGLAWLTSYGMVSMMPQR